MDASFISFSFFSFFALWHDTVSNRKYWRCAKPSGIQNKVCRDWWRHTEYHHLVLEENVSLKDFSYVSWVSGGEFPPKIARGRGVFLDWEDWEMFLWHTQVLMGELYRWRWLCLRVLWVPPWMDKLIYSHLAYGASLYNLLCPSHVKPVYHHYHFTCVASQHVHTYNLLLVSFD